MSLILDGHSLNLQDFIKVVRSMEKVELSKQAIKKIKESRSYVDKIVEQEKVVYGINTGFGKLANVSIGKEEVSQLQENLIKSHATGVGKLFNEEITRGIMLLRINTLIKGFSGVRLETLEKLIEYLNNNILPAIPEQGSLGASGDLAPLSHMALPLIGLGEVIYKGSTVNTMDVLKELQIEPLECLHAKEGLCLINGTQVMNSVGAITTYDAIQLTKLADISCSLTMEALNGVIEAMDERVHISRGHKGQIDAASNIRRMTDGSEYITHQGDLKVQDPYSLRCIPQVHGATKDALNYIKEKIEIEMNAATDNPLIFGEDVISAGNFHGQPLAISFDFLKVAVAELANIAERRIERLVNPQLSEGLPPFLVANTGVNSGFMIMQYTAASLVSENKVLAHPASVDSITSSANQEDHVSMGTIASRGARDILENVKKVIAIELISAAQALDFRDKKTFGKGTNAAYKTIRKQIDFIDEDIIMYPLINKMVDLIEDEVILNNVNNVIGELI